VKNNDANMYFIRVDSVHLCFSPSSLISSAHVERSGPDLKYSCKIGIGFSPAGITIFSLGFVSDCSFSLWLNRSRAPRSSRLRASTAEGEVSTDHLTSSSSDATGFFDSTSFFAGSGLFFFFVFVSLLEHFSK